MTTTGKIIFTNGKLVEGWQLKTIHLRGQVSQGLLTPLSDYPEITGTEPGMDLTETNGKEKLSEGFAIQGECIGESIQDNRQ